VIDNDDKVGGFVLLDKIVDLLFELKLELEHVHDRFFALSQINVKFLAEHASVHGVVQSLLDENALTRLWFSYHKDFSLLVVE
jgi:hypothetical protein